MNRRATLHRLFALGLAALPFASHAQSAHRAFRIGYVGLVAPRTQEAAAFVERVMKAFGRGLEEHGLVEGRDLVIERHFGDGRAQIEAEIVAGLVQSKIDLILVASSSAASAAKSATGTIPVVMLGVTNPESTGLVESLARPGGNITGISNQAADYRGKVYEIVLAALPGAARVAVLWNPDNQGSALAFNEGDVPAARLKGVKLLSLPVRRSEDLELAATAIARERPNALLAHAALSPHLSRVIDVATKNALPLFGGSRRWAAAGALASFGTDPADTYRLAAGYIARILKGVNPRDLPIQQPTKFELVINRRTAKAIGLKLQQPLLVRADEVIE